MQDTQSLYFSFTLSHHNYCGNSLPKWKFNFTTFQTFTQFQLNFPSMPLSSDFRMLIPQQSSTTPVRPAESINTKTEVFFMRELRNTKIIAVDHGYGNMKTANTVTPTGIKAYETEPIFTGNILEYNGIYYRIGEGHKEFMQWFLQHYGIVRPPSIHLIC